MATKLRSSFAPKPLPKPHPAKSRRFVVSFKLADSSDQKPNPPPLIISLLRVIPDWADDVKEQGMRRRRTLYNHDKWLEHRSSLRHIRHLLSSLTSRVILSLIPPVTTFTAVAALVAAYNTAVLMDLLPGFLPVLRTSSLPYQLTAPALALLLVFRTEASYSRYQEGRLTWTKVVAAANDLARLVIDSVQSPDDSDIKKALLEYIVAFPIALKCHVIYGSDIDQDLRGSLDKDDLSVILESKHRPHCIVQFISESLKMLNIEDSRRNLLDSRMSCFHEGISVCDQLMGIPIPLSYTRLTSRFLVLWHLTLPVILWDDCHWIVVPATFISAASLFCIEEVGVLIEEPFPMLALDDVCDTVRQNVQQVIDTQSVIQQRVAAKKILRRTSSTRSNSSNKSVNGRPV